MNLDFVAFSLFFFSVSLSIFLYYNLSISLLEKIKLFKSKRFEKNILKDWLILYYVIKFAHTGSWPKCDDSPARLDHYTGVLYRSQTLRGNCLWSQCARNRE